ncbi:MAG: hypothetical protein K0Q79_194 [Flavipsychrobacter sp.]|jgi:hypothetical protein|nr:hypothetical protein [Flavipsychrobacter sp.]
MKNILLGVLFSLGVAAPAITHAQSFTFPHDTVTQSVGGFANIHNNITNSSSSSVSLQWRVIASNFPADWLTSSAIGICDACTCISNTSNQLWNPSTSTGTQYTCSYAASATNDFHLQLDLTAATSGGSRFITVQVTETGFPSKNMTFIINKVPVGVPSVTNANDMVIYPNPAHDDINVVFSGDVKTIAVFNIIGKVMATYRVAGSSANINLENVPSGIYFLRLLNSQENVVATKKFTKQ